MERTAAKYYPVFLELTGRRCLVVGAGKVALRKVRALLEAGAEVSLVSPEALEELKKLVVQGAIRWRRGEFEDGDLDGVFLVIGATDDPEVNRRVYRAADKASRMVNIVDEPELCNFIVPSVLTRGDFQVAVSSGGASPILARKIREVLGYRFGPEYAVVVDELARLRRELKDRVPREEKRRQFWEMLIDLDFFDSLEGPEIRARIKERAEQCLSQLAD